MAVRWGVVWERMGMRMVLDGCWVSKVHRVVVQRCRGVYRRVVHRVVVQRCRAVEGCRVGTGRRWEVVDRCGRGEGYSWASEEC